MLKDLVEIKIPKFSYRWQVFDLFVRDLFHFILETQLAFKEHVEVKLKKPEQTVHSFFKFGAARTVCL